MEEPPFDKIEPIEIEEVETHEVSTVEHNNAMQKMLEEMIIVSQDNGEKCIVEPSCPICTSPLRLEAEDLWEQSHSYEEIKKLFKEKAGLKLGKPVIENHMHHHMYSGVNEIQKIEYLNRIKRLQAHQPSTIHYLELGLTALAERLMGINSVTPQNNESQADIEKMKSAETTKIVAQMQNVAKTRAALMGEMFENGDVVIIPTKDFERIFSEAIILCETDGEKKIVKKIVDRMYSIRQSSNS